METRSQTLFGNALVRATPLPRERDHTLPPSLHRNRIELRDSPSSLSSPTGAISPAEAAAYGIWRSLHWPSDSNGFNAQPMAEPESDGVVNALEDAFGIDPTVASRIGLPTVVRNGLALEITFFCARSEVVYEVQKTTDLQTWTTVATSPGTVGDLVTVSVPFPSGFGFVRIKTTLPFATPFDAW